ncbi:MAG TPA: hypothetical protein VGV93_04000 [Acidimicrobiales bacterium]|nr:hypothetical protein [Acidimicrobiales bacterium]
MVDDDPVKDAARELAAAARAVATGVAVAARAKAERQASRASQEARRLEVRSRANGAWRGVEKRDRPEEGPAQAVEPPLAEQHRQAVSFERWVELDRS